MKCSGSRVLFGVFLLAIVVACREKETNSSRPVLDVRYSTIRSIYASAACRGPKGEYRTRVQSNPDSSCLFSQVYSYKPEPFFARLTKDSGFITNARDSILDTLPRGDAEAIRSHQFHRLQTDPDYFFRDMRPIHDPEKSNQVFSAKDRLGQIASLAFDLERKVLLKVSLLNPMDTTGHIDILYQKWLETAFGQLVQELQIVQAGRDTYYFSFDTILINGSLVLPQGTR